MTTVNTEPIIGDIRIRLGTDNELDFPLEDEAGAYVDPTGFTGNLEIDTDITHTAVKLSVPFSVVTDPQDGAKKLIRVTIAAAQLQPGNGVTQWPVTDKDLKYPYSLRRTNTGSVTELRSGYAVMIRARV